VVPAVSKASPEHGVRKAAAVSTVRASSGHAEAAPLGGTLEALQARIAEIEAEKAVLREKVRERVRRFRAKGKS
jgi:hypothetical protein